MQNNDDLFAGLEVKGKIIAGPDPVIAVNEQSQTVDNSDLFEGLEFSVDAVSDVTPQTGQSGTFEIVTGSKRIEDRPELGVLPEFGTTAEGDTPTIAAGFLSTFDPQAQMDMIKTAIPEANFETTADGSTIIEVPTQEGGTRRSVLNRPGLSPQDAMTGIAQVLSFIPAAKLASLGKTLAVKMGLGGAAAGATEQALQEGGVALGREERDPTSTAIAAVTGGLAEAVVPAIQAVRGARQAAKVGAGIDEIEQVAESVATAQKATQETGIPLFQSQQTAVPSAIERQAFIAQLPAGSRTAVKALRKQNEAASEAVESFLNTIAPPQAVVTGQERVRTAAQSVIENAKRIRSERASPIYQDAFKAGAEVDLKPIQQSIEVSLADLPAGGEIARSLLKVRSLIKGKEAKEAKTIFHGTAEKFDNFDVKKSADGGIWFTDKKSLIEKGEVGASGKGRILERTLNEGNVRLGGWDEADKFSTDELIQKGFDGLKLKDGNETTYKIFFPEKLGSTSQAKESLSAPSLKLLHNAKLEMDQMLNKVGESSLGNTTKREVSELRDLLLTQMDDASPDYKSAREVFAANSPQVTVLQDSIIGKIAKLNDDQLKQVGAKIFDPAQTNPQVLLQAKNAVKKVDPDAWDQIVRVELEKRLGKIKSVQEGGSVENLPGQLFRALFPNDKSTKVLFDSVDGEAKANLKFLQTALGRARLGRPGGSQTAIRAEIKEEIKGGFSQGLRDFVLKPISGVVEAGATTITGASERAAFDRRVATMARALFDPTWKAEMKSLRKLNPNSPASARAITQLLNDIEQSDAKSKPE